MLMVIDDVKQANGNEAFGLGDSQFSFAVYIANQPAMPEYQSLTQLKSLQHGELHAIGQACGNGWRKVFNVYAKLLYALDKNDFKFATLAPTWQQYRDQYLLQANSGTALVFSPPILKTLKTLKALKTSIPDPLKTKYSNTGAVKTLHIICGRTYAKQLINEGKLATELLWLDEEFAVDMQQGVIVCPYFDYRQLSNIKIQRLSMMLSAVIKGQIIDFNL
jgi:hypothetical protein